MRNKHGDDAADCIVRILLHLATEMFLFWGEGGGILGVINDKIFA